MRNIFQSVSKEIIAAVFFAFIALVALSLFFFPTQTSKSIQQKIAGSSDKKISTGTPSKISPSPTHIPTGNPTEEVLPTTTTQTIQITIVVTPTPLPQSQSEKALVHVTINGNSSFDVTLDKGKNQCDVLTAAKNDGKISQLLMKYDSSLDSYGIYQINTIGKDNSVWWTYEVNGKSPSMGCNHVAANNNDSVSWKYIGQ